MCVLCVLKLPASQSETLAYYFLLKCPGHYQRSVFTTFREHNFHTIYEEVFTLHTHSIVNDINSINTSSISTALILDPEANKNLYGAQFATATFMIKQSLSYSL